MTAQTTQAFAAIGDTQRTMAYQILLGKEANNHAERLLLIDHIRQRNPEFLLVAGDLVTCGHAESDWAYFDDLVSVLKCPVLPVVGNHDYFFFKEAALINLVKRFPLLQERTWYTHRIGELAIVVVDSNKSTLKENWEIQKEWFSRQLQKLDLDPTIKGILVSGHHPPFTNSFEISPHRPTQELLQAFYQSRKTLFYLSGHCHAYERFEKEGKHFIVSGGGGGPRQKLRTGSEARFPDLFAGGPIRPFHYLWISLNSEGLKIEVSGLEKGALTFFELESFTLRWAKQ